MTSAKLSPELIATYAEMFQKGELSHPSAVRAVGLLLAHIAALSDALKNMSLLITTMGTLYPNATAERITHHIVNGPTFKTAQELIAEPEIK